MDETKLLRKVCQGNQKAFEQIMERYTAYVAAIIYGIIGQNMSTQDVEEVVSDVFVTLWKQANQVQKGKLKAYLSQIARYKALGKLRERQITIPLEDDEIPLLKEEEFPEQLYLKREKQSVIRQALLAMEYPDREIFLRHYYYYQTVTCIADEMKLSPSAIKSRLARGRQKLKKYLCKGGYFYEDNRMDG